MIVTVEYKNFDIEAYKRDILNLNTEKLERRAKYLEGLNRYQMDETMFKDLCKEAGIPIAEDYKKCKEYIALQFGPEQTIVTDQSTGKILTLETKKLKVVEISEQIATCMIGKRNNIGYQVPDPR